MTSAHDTPDVPRRELGASIDAGEHEIVVSLVGNADLRGREPLAATLRSAHEHALGRPGAEVVVDLLALEFMNSSCFKIVVGWLVDVRELDVGQRYRVRLRSNPALLWQRRSLHALRALAPEIITVETR